MVSNCESFQSIVGAKPAITNHVGLYLVKVIRIPAVLFAEIHIRPCGVIIVIRVRTRLEEVVALAFATQAGVQFPT